MSFNAVRYIALRRVFPYAIIYIPTESTSTDVQRMGTAPSALLITPVPPTQGEISSWSHKVTYRYKLDIGTKILNRSRIANASCSKQIVVFGLHELKWNSLEKTVSSSLVLYNHLHLVEQHHRSSLLIVYSDIGTLLLGKLPLDTLPYHMEGLLLLFPGASFRHGNVTSALLTGTGWRRTPKTYDRRLLPETLYGLLVLGGSCPVYTKTTKPNHLRAVRLLDRCTQAICGPNNYQVVSACCSGCRETACLYQQALRVNWEVICACRRVSLRTG